MQTELSLANANADIVPAIGRLEETDNWDYTHVSYEASWAAKLRALVSNTATKWIDVVKDLFPAGIYVSYSLFTSAGATTSGLVVEPSQENFELIIEQDLTTFQKQDEDVNL